VTLDDLSYAVNLLFDDKEMTPMPKALVQEAAHHVDGTSLPEQVQILIQLAQHAADALDAIPGNLRRYVEGANQAETLYRSMWAFSAAAEQFCTRCEQAIIAQLSAG
jgi:hypothetical protein